MCLLCRRESVCLESLAMPRVLEKKVNFRSNENRSIKVVALQKPYQLKVENIVD